MSGYTSAEDGRTGGLRGVVSATLWAAGSVGLVTAVMMWAYDLGARDPADVPALAAAGDWRRAPADPGGRQVLGADNQAYRALAPDPSAAPDVANAFGAAPIERAPDEDLAPPPPLASIAPDRGASLDQTAFAALSRDAVANAEEGERRTILLDDPAQPQRSALDYLAVDAPSTPPNIGVGAETPPQNSIFYQPEAATGDARAAAAALPGGPPGGRVATAPPDDMPPEAAPAAIDEPPAGATAAAPAPAAAPAAPAPEETAVAQLAPAPQAPASGVYQIQLAALDSVRAVESRWNALREREADLLGAFKLDIRPVNVGDARLYRLRLGAFESRSDAAKLCADLRRRGVECFPARR